MDLLDLDRRALAATGAHVGAVGSDDLTRPTPCAEWDVRALLNHVLGNNHLYASAVEGVSQQQCPTDAPPDVRLVATLGRTV